MEDANTSSIEFIQPLEHKLTTLDDIGEHLSRRSTFFLSTLRNIHRHSEDRHGWQEIQGKANYKLPSDESGKGIFTGSKLCDVSTLAIIKGLERIAAQPTKLSFLRLTVDDFDEGEINKNYTRLTRDDHYIASLTDDTGDTLYVDSTYGQVKHDQASKILVTRQKLEELYKNPKIDQTIDAQSLQQMYEVLVENSDDITEEDFKRLVKTLL